MKKLYLLLAAVLMMSVSTNSYAQFMGGNSVSHSTTSDSFSTFWLGYAPTNWKSGDVATSGYNTFSLGFTHLSSLAGSPLAFEYGAYVDWMNKSKSSSATNFLDIKVPINITYPLPIADAITFYPYIGLNARVFLLGKNTYKSGENSITTDFYGENSNYNRLGLGYQVGLCALISKVILRIGYEDMFTSVHKDNTVKFNYLTLGVGIPF